MSNKAGLFSPGLFARVRVTGAAPYAAVLLPDEAIGTDQTNKFVYVVGDGRHGGAQDRRARAAASKACAWCAKACSRTSG